MEPTIATRSPAAQPTGCCPPFDPTLWDDKEIVWKDKPFLKEHVRALFHVPLGLGRTVTRAMEKIAGAGAAPPTGMMLADDSSPWGSDLYLDVTRPVPDADMASLSGTFLTKVFEGPFRDAGKWASEMKRYVESRGKRISKLYFDYTTCPACAKAYGKNYVVLFAKVD